MSSPSAAAPPATAPGTVRRAGAAGLAIAALRGAGSGRVSGLRAALRGTTSASSRPRTSGREGPGGGAGRWWAARRRGRGAGVVVRVVDGAGAVAEGAVCVVVFTAGVRLDAVVVAAAGVGVVVCVAGLGLVVEVVAVVWGVVVPWGWPLDVAGWR